MPEANQFTLSHRELIELIIKHVDVHDGRWGLLVNLNIATGQFGPTPDQANPGAMIGITQIGINRLIPGTPVPEGGLVVDAAKVNPKKKK